MIAIADLHLLENNPINRIDNCVSASLNKLDFLCKLAKEDDGILTVSGDFFDIPKPSPFLLRKVIKKLMEYNIKIYCTPGQHDLPNHSLKEINKSGLGVLAASEVIELLLNPKEPIEIKRDIFLYGCPFKLRPIQPDISKFNILLWHEMIIQKTLWTGQRAINSNIALRKFKYDIMIIGDNHQTFIDEYKGRVLVNPGSVFRKTIKQVKHEPVAFWTNFKEYELIKIPIENSVFNLESTVKSEKIDDSFVTLLDSNTEIELSFKENLKSYLLSNSVNIKTRNKIMEFTNEL